MLGEESRLLDLGCFLNRTLVGLKAISVVRGFQVQAFQAAFGMVRRVVIYWGVQLRDEGRNFLLCGEGCTTFLGEISLELLVY